MTLEITISIILASHCAQKFSISSTAKVCHYVCTLLELIFFFFYCPEIRHSVLLLHHTYFFHENI